MNRGVAGGVGCVGVCLLVFLIGAVCASMISEQEDARETFLYKPCADVIREYNSVAYAIGSKGAATHVANVYGVSVREAVDKLLDCS